MTLVAGINPARTRPGGIRSYVLGLARYLSSVGVEVTVVGVGGPVANDSFRFITATADPAATSFDFQRALRKTVRDAPPPDGLIHAQRPDDLVPFAAGRRGTGLVVTIHGDPFPGIRQRHGPWVAWAYRRLESRGVKAASRVLFVDGMSREALSRRYPREESKFMNSRVGLDLEVFRPQDASTSRSAWELDGRPHILFAGRFESEKNLPLLVHAIALCETGPVVLFAGAGPGLTEAELGLREWPHRFLGTIPHEQMPSLYSAVDATVLPSTREATPMACLESLACGTPVVATRAGQLPQIVRSGENGYLAAAEPGEFAKAIDQAIREREHLRHACRSSVEAFGWDQVGPSLVRVYREALR